MNTKLEKYFKPYESDLNDISKRCKYELKLDRVRLKEDVYIRNNRDGSKGAMLNMMVLDEKNNVQREFCGGIYIPKGRKRYENFLATLRKGEEYIIIHGMRGIYDNIYRINLFLDPMEV